MAKTNEGKLKTTHKIIEYVVYKIIISAICTFKKNLKVLSPINVLKTVKMKLENENGNVYLDNNAEKGVFGKFCL